MRPAPTRVLFLLLAAAAGVLAAITGQLIFIIVAVIAALLLASSLATSHVPLTRELGSFRGRPVDVRFWGAPPPEEHLAVASVNLISVGVHVFFSQPSGRQFHLKVAQPRHLAIAADHVVIGSARYVQWQGKKVTPVEGADAVFIALTSRVGADPASEAPDCDVSTLFLARRPCRPPFGHTVASSQTCSR